MPGHQQELLVHGDRALVIATLGYPPVVFAAQVPAVAPARWLGRTRLLEVDISDPARMRVLRERGRLVVRGGAAGEQEQEEEEGAHALFNGGARTPLSSRRMPG